MAIGMSRKIVIVGWDGRSNPIYRFDDELRKPAYLRSFPTVPEILEQFPEANFTTAELTPDGKTFKVIKLRDLPIC